MAKMRSRGQRKQRIDRSQDSYGSGRFSHSTRNGELDGQLAELEQLDTIRARLDEMSAQLDRVDDDYGYEDPPQRPARRARGGQKSSKALNAVARAMDRLDMDHYEREPRRPRMERAIDQLQDGDINVPISRAARMVTGEADDHYAHNQSRQMVDTIKRDIAQLGERLAAHEMHISARLDSLDDIGDLKDQIGRLGRTIVDSREDAIDRAHLADLAERIAMVTEDNRASLGGDIATLTERLDRINRAALDSTTDQINQLSLHISALSEAHRDARSKDVSDLGARLDMMAITLEQLSQQTENIAPQQSSFSELSSGFDAGIRGLFEKLDGIASDIEKYQENGETGSIKRDVAAVAQKLDKLDTQLTQNEQTMRQLVAHQSEHRQSLDQSVIASREALENTAQKFHQDMTDLVEKGIRGLYDRLDALENEGAVDIEQSSSISEQISKLTTQLRDKTRPLDADAVIDELGKINLTVSQIRTPRAASVNESQLGQTISAAIQPEFKALQDQLRAMKNEVDHRDGAHLGEMLDEQSQLVARRLQDTNERLSSLSRIERSLAGIESQMSSAEPGATSQTVPGKAPIDAKARKAITIVHKSVETVGSRLDEIEQNLAKNAALKDVPRASKTPPTTPKPTSQAPAKQDLANPKTTQAEAAATDRGAKPTASQSEIVPNASQEARRPQKPVFELDASLAASEMPKAPVPTPVTEPEDNTIEAIENKMKSGTESASPVETENKTPHIETPAPLRDEDVQVAAQRATSFIAQARAAARENRSIANELGIPAVLRRNQIPEEETAQAPANDTNKSKQKSMFGWLKRDKTKVDAQTQESEDKFAGEDSISSSPLSSQVPEGTEQEQSERRAQDGQSAYKAKTIDLDEDWQPSPLDPTPDELAYHAPEMERENPHEHDPIDDDQPQGFFARNRTLIAASAFVVVMAGGAAGLLTQSLPTDGNNAQLAAVEPLPNGADSINTASIAPQGEIMSDLDQPFPGIDTDGDTSPYASLAPDSAQADRDVTNLIDPNQTQLASASTKIGPDLPVTYALPPAQIGPIKLREAAANGEAPAQYEVASIYANGRNIDKDNNLAAIWFERAAILGFAPAQYRIGTFYESGIGVEKDLKIAKQWYERAAEAGNRMAMHNLASIYASGELGQQDFSQASQWFQKAANRGVKDSQFNLGMLYARGLGVDQDLAKSYKWFSLAARFGDPDARNMRQDIARALDVASLKNAQNDVATWRPEKSVIEANYAPAGTWDTTLSAGPKVSDQNVVARVQSVLANLGFEIGVIDGLMGPQTANAIRNFEKATGMTQTGEVNPRLLAVFGTQPV